MFFKFQIFDYFLEMSRDTYWVYADVSCAAYSLSDIDTINDDGKMNDVSALYLIVKGVIFDKNIYILTCILPL